MLINKCEVLVVKHYNDPKVFFKYSKDMNSIYKNIKDNNLSKVQKILILCADMIADMLSNEKLQ